MRQSRRSPNTKDCAACRFICLYSLNAIKLCRISTYPMQCIYLVYAKCQATPGLHIVTKKERKSANKKNSQLVLRLDKDERDAFVDLCKELDTSAAREIRRFIRGFMKENESV
jgi:hypothetical protein